ncbi:MAG: phosphoribosyltransferase family protein [Polyangiales bacterium]
MDGIERAVAETEQDRKDAGILLAERLSVYRERRPLIVAISTGGVSVAYEIAWHLSADLDVFMVNTIPAPGRDDVALGAVAADGTLHGSAPLRQAMKVSEREFLALGKIRQKQAHLLEQRYRLTVTPANPRGRWVIVVDDRSVEGFAMRAAIRSLRARGAARVVVALAVAAPGVAQSLDRQADAVFVLREQVLDHRSQSLTHVDDAPSEAALGILARDGEC